MKHLLLFAVLISTVQAATSRPQNSSEAEKPAAVALEEEQEQRSPKFYIEPSAGYTGSHGDFYSGNTLGVGLGIGAGGFLSESFSLGAFYKAKALTNGDFGLLGGGNYSASVFGLEADLTVARGKGFELRLGADAARVHAEGMHSVLFFPYAVSEIKTWGFGPTLSLAFFFGEGNWGLGLDLGYLYVLGREASVSYITGSESTSEIPSFGVYDASMALHIRIF